MFLRKKDAPGNSPTHMIVGLGNPGTKYDNTRHNIGFICLDMLAEKLNLRLNKLKFKSLYTITEISGVRCMVMKPQTFMNNSGIAVSEASRFYKIPPSNIIVVFDDISLAPGKLRIRKKGSAGGHNGLKSIIFHLRSDEFPRIKVGVGAKPHEDYDLADWVLSSFPKEEIPAVKSALSNACDAMPLMLNGKTDEAMNLYN